MFPTRAHVVMAWRQSGLLERTWVSLSYGFATPKVFDLCLSISLPILSHFHHLVCPTVAFCLSSNRQSHVPLWQNSWQGNALVEDKRSPEEMGWLLRRARA